MVEEHVSDMADGDGPDAPFLSRADQPFERKRRLVLTLSWAWPV